MPSNFGISVVGGEVNFSLNEELGEVDVQKMLTFHAEDIDALLRTHSADQAYWEALALRLKLRYEEFKDIWVRKWWARANRYSRVMLGAYGDKSPTNSAIEDMAVQLYSQDVSDTERQKFGVIAHAFATKKGTYRGSPDEYYVEMFAQLLQNPSWFFENVVTMEKKLESDFNIVQTVAKRLNSQAFHLDLYAKLHAPKKGNIGPMAIDERAVLDGIGGKVYE